MSADQISYLLGQGTTKTYQIPVEHLDYKFIETCKDIKHLEKILTILRSGEEGFYPDLILFCEKRIESLAPNSRALRRDKPAATASDFTTEEWEKINNEIKSWIMEMKEEEYKIQYATTEVFKEKVENMPPVRSTDSCYPTSQNKMSGNRQIKKKNVPRDYREWDKFNMEKECSKIDGYGENYSNTSFSSNKGLPKTDIDTTGMSTKEKNFIANREKEKGNEAFVTGDYKEAVVYYIRSISAFPTVAAYNNKAQAEIKLQKWHVALQDCETVLKMDPGNIKALMRRAAVYTNLHNFRAAAEDLKKVLHIEPENTIAKKNLSDIEKNLKESEPISQTQIKGKRILIQDIEELDGDEELGNETEHENGSGDKKTAVLVGGEITTEKTEMGNAQKKFSSKGGGYKFEPKEAQKLRDPLENNVKKGTPEKMIAKVLQDSEREVNDYLDNDKKNSENREVTLKNAESSAAGKSISALLPPTAATLKARGNELFKNGQFGEAMLRYSEAIENVINSGTQSPEDLSILYSNRAACYLKEGNCVDCIQDCNSALELHPYSLKPLLRRAMAYESMERYRQAYVDYKTLLQIDSGIQAANDSVNRITRTLIDQDGPNWREKLSPIPVVPVSAQLHWWHGGNITSETKQKKNAVRHGDQQSQIPDEKSEEMFKSLKSKGNEHVKKGNYEEALIKYNECIKLNSQEQTIYTNRALCYLKLFQYEEAKKDCDYVLQIDESNIKALYRRALAYKGLQLAGVKSYLFDTPCQKTRHLPQILAYTYVVQKFHSAIRHPHLKKFSGVCMRMPLPLYTKNYKASTDDLNKVLLIDSSIDEAKKELQETTLLLKLKKECTDNGKQKQRKKIEIQEVNECEEEEDGEACASDNSTVNRHSTKGEPETTVPLNSSEKLIISKPSNAYEFGQIINVVNASKDVTACAELLTMIEPKDLPVLLSNKLEGDIFLIFIQALQSDVFCQNPGLVYHHLVHLSKAERFKMVLTLLNRNEVEQVQQLFDSLSKEQNQKFSFDDLESLKRDFEL